MENSSTWNEGYNTKIVYEVSLYEVFGGFFLLKISHFFIFLVSNYDNMSVKYIYF